LIHVDHFRGTDMAAVVGEVSNEVRETSCMAGWQTIVRGKSRSGALPVVKPGDPAQVQYTSGTTGEPKGALLPHRGLVTNAYYVAARAGLNGGVFVSPMPLFHTAGSAMSVLGCVTTRSTYVLPLLFDPELVLAAMERERGNLTLGVPTMLIALLEQQRKSKHDLSSLRTALCGGAPVPVELLRRVEEGLGCDLTPVYGQTELSPIVCQTSPDDTLEDKANSSGRPLWQVEVRVVDPASGEILPSGLEGEIQARGYQSMIGYFDMPKATAETIVADGWVRTGDLGTLDDRGYVQITGRLRDMIIRGGENIYPREIEAVLFEHPSVADVAVFGIPHDHWGEVIGAAVRASNPDAPPTVSELQAHCRAALAPFKLPTEWFICTEFPLTGSGKVQKFRLREQLQTGVLTRLSP
jgi:fatty-acyl-CoA synthase/long-chain acyl-CoA synthetase